MSSARFGNRRSIRRVKRVNRVKLVEDVAEEAQEIGIKEAIKIAKKLVPVDTGKLKKSIGRIGDTSFGSRVRYAGYVETGTRRTRAQPYLTPAAQRVRKMMPQIIDKLMRRRANG